MVDKVGIEFPDFDRDIIKEAISDQISDIRKCNDEVVDVGEDLYSQFITNDKSTIDMDFGNSLLLVMIIANYTRKMIDTSSDKAKIQECKRITWHSKKLSTELVVYDKTGNFIGNRTPEWGMD